jgi:hypothetical protein
MRTTDSVSHATSSEVNWDSMNDVASHYLEEMKRQFRGHKRMGEAAMAQLEDKDFLVALDPGSNSVAALVKHIAGNARSRFTDFLTSDGEKPDRFRDQEFEISMPSTMLAVVKPEAAPGAEIREVQIPCLRTHRRPGQGQSRIHLRHRSPHL